MSKTITDPIEAARQAYADAKQRADTARAEKETLKQGRGPLAATAAQLALANANIEYADLAVEHALEDVQDAEAKALRERREEIAADIRDNGGDPVKVAAALRKIEEGVAELAAMTTRRNNLIGTWSKQMRAAGIPALRANARPDETTCGLGWKDAGMGTSDQVFTADRAIGVLNIGILIAAGVTRGCDKAGLSPAFLRPGLEINGVNDQLAADPETWLRTHY